MRQREGMKSPCKTVSFGGNGHIQTNEVILIYNYSPQIFLTTYPICTSKNNIHFRTVNVNRRYSVQFQIIFFTTWYFHTSEIQDFFFNLIIVVAAVALPIYCCLLGMGELSAISTFLEGILSCHSAFM